MPLRPLIIQWGGYELTLIKLLSASIIALIAFIPFSPAALAAGETSGNPAVATAPAAGETAGAVTALVNDAEIAGAVLTEEGRVLVPMRAFFEAAGAEVYWDAASRTVRAFTGERTVTLQVGNAEASLSGRSVSLDAPPRIINDRVYIPLRFATDALGGEVSWNGEKQVATVNLNRPVDGEVVATPTGATTPASPVSEEDVLVLYSAEEIDLFVRVVNAEAYGEPFEGKVAVAAVILNRVRSNRFPNSITEVLLAPNQFTVVKNGQVNRNLHPDSRSAVIRALNGEDPTGGALYFNATRYTNGSFWTRLRNEGWQEIRIGNQTFFFR